MSEGHMGGAPGAEKPPEAGGLDAQVVPAEKKFFLVEYIQEMRKAFRWVRSAPKPEEGTLKKAKAGLRRWAKGKKARFGVAAVVAIMVVSWGLFSAQASSTAVYQGGGPPGPGPSGNTGNMTIAGVVDEDSTKAVNVTLNATRLSGFTVTLTWTDESVGANQRNQPDQLGFTVMAPSGQNWTAPMSTSGTVNWKLDDTSKDYGAGAWTITVQGGNMGDVQPITGRPCLPLNLVCRPDTSKGWTLKMDWAW